MIANCKTDRKLAETMRMLSAGLRFACGDIFFFYIIPLFAVIEKDPLLASHTHGNIRIWLYKLCLWVSKSFFPGSAQDPLTLVCTKLNQRTQLVPTETEVLTKWNCNCLKMVNNIIPCHLTWIICSGQEVGRGGRAKIVLNGCWPRCSARSVTVNEVEILSFSFSANTGCAWAVAIHSSHTEIALFYYYNLI